MTRPLLAAALIATVSASSAQAIAQAAEQEGCNEDYVAAQRTRKEGKLLQAREHLLACTRELCMDVIEKDCAAWLAAVDASTPTVVIFARDRWGDETLNVRVLIDGVIVRDVIDAKAIPVDPGTHTFRFETTDATPVEQKVILREGEKNRRVEVHFGVGGAGDDERVPGDDSDRFRFHLRDLGWVLGGAGVASVVGASLFFVSASAAESDLDDASCAPACPKASTDAIDRQRVIGRVMLVVGAASVVASACMLVWGPQPDDRDTAATRFELAVVPGGAYALVRGRL